MTEIEHHSPLKLAATDGLAAMELPPPRLDAEVSVAEALRRRRTTREFSERKLDAQTLSNLLWAADGVNRVNGPFGHSGHTAASASNSQEIIIYVALEAGVFLYDPEAHRLVPVIHGDCRRLAIGPHQSRAGDRAAVRLIYVADVDRLAHAAGFDEPGLHDPEVQKSYFFVDCGLITANVYLFAASAGLAAWFHNCDRAALAKKLPLKAGRRVLFAQTIGFPAPRGEE